MKEKEDELSARRESTLSSIARNRLTELNCPKIDPKNYSKLRTEDPQSNLYQKTG